VTPDAEESSVTLTNQQPRAYRPRQRNTRPRAAVERAIQRGTRPLTAGEILEHGRAEIPTLGIATVYRTLGTMAAEGTVETIQLPNDAPRYHRPLDREHHYFTCRVCQRVFWIFGSMPEVARMTPPGFLLEDHSVRLYGACAECRELRPR
jgi:Fur family transcriptional regulator, ferric uptake regulator